MKTRPATELPETGEIQNIVFMYPPARSPYSQQIGLRLKRENHLEFFEPASARVIASQLGALGTGLLVLYVQEFTELKLALRCLKELRGFIQIQALRVVCITDLTDPRALSLLERRGCAEIYPSHLLWNTLSSTINNALKLLMMQQMLRSQPPSDKERNPQASESPGIELIPFNKKLTSKLKIWVRTGTGEDSRIMEAKIVEFGEETLILDLNEHILEENQTALLILEDGSKAGSKTRASVTVRWASHSESDNHQLVSIPFGKRLKKLLAPTVKKQAQLQLRIFEFLRAARGH